MIKIRILSVVLQESYGLREIAWENLYVDTGAYMRVPVNEH